MSCELWVNNQAVSRVSSQSAYIEPALSVYIISSLHAKQSPSRHITSWGCPLIVLFWSLRPGPYKDQNRTYQIFTSLWQCLVWYSVGIRTTRKNSINTHFMDCGWIDVLSMSYGRSAADASVGATYRTITVPPKNVRTFITDVLRSSSGHNFAEWSIPIMIRTWEQP